MRIGRLTLGLVILITFTFVSFALADGISGPATARVNTEVEFSYSGSGVPRQWCFGDDDSSCTAYGSQDDPVSHTYTESGTYRVEVTVDIGGSAQQFHKVIVVSP